MIKTLVGVEIGLEVVDILRSGIELTEDHVVGICRSRGMTQKSISIYAGLTLKAAKVFVEDFSKLESATIKELNGIFGTYSSSKEFFDN